MLDKESVIRQFTKGSGLTIALILVVISDERGTIADTVTICSNAIAVQAVPARTTDDAVVG